MHNYTIEQIINYLVFDVNNKYIFEWLGENNIEIIINKEGIRWKKIKIS